MSHQTIGGFQLKTDSSFNFAFVVSCLCAIQSIFSVNFFFLSIIIERKDEELFIIWNNYIFLSLFRDEKQNK